MHRFFTLLFSLLLSSVMMQAVAQRNIYVWTNSCIDVLSSSSVDSLTFSDGKGPFKITTSPAASVGKDGFNATGRVVLNDNVKRLLKAYTVGFCYSATNTEPTINDSTVALNTAFGNKSVSLSGLASGSTYYYRFYVTLVGETFYGDVCSATTLVDKSRTINGHRFVDLGLPSGLLWAETNIGATTAEQYGDYFAWGETETKAEYTADNSVWYEVAHSGNLSATEDVATVKWGSEVRTPTSAEFSELLNTSNCSWTRTTVEDVTGYKVVSNANGNELFFPAAGFYGGSELKRNGTVGYYWASSSSSDKNADYLYMDTSFTAVFNSARHYGYPVRAVAE